MAAIVRLDDLDDPRLRDYVDLRDVQLRLRLESERGLFLAEGEKVVRRAVESGHRPRSFLMSPRWLDGLADILDASDAPCFVLDDAAIERLTGFHVHRGALAALERPDLPTPEQVLADARRVVVIEDLADHTNVGAIFRSVAALGFDAVLLSPRCADPLYRRAIKVSMGSVFWLPYARVEDWYGAPDLLRAAGYTTYAMTLADDSVPIDQVDHDVERLAVVVGSEGHGLTARWEQGADHRITIPMAADIDSLNVASSVAVACWELRARS
ncbi:TrmH family RNA methyltransferase [Aeromicrobium chenweiae]|uniref:rRNA methyltransferase n=1 Tax=Aeromicrobium chenweiae TaxID=2079793 RepID=A0A2S0WLM7_9ACTN|nr:RNA methyltransferase [Aeromicrobium chenweiae]AWB92235.1 rRNA methyltransferase [Aeromicrobium chenweiae]TGN31480.1 RNA methyltransferase [Aeromicrobium chenweiae]